MAARVPHSRSSPFSSPPVQRLKRWAAKLLAQALAGVVGLILLSVLFVSALITLVLGHTMVGLALLAALVVGTVAFVVLAIRQMRRTVAASRREVQGLRAELGVDAFALRKHCARAKLGALWRSADGLNAEERSSLHSCLAATEEALGTLQAPTASNSREVYAVFRAAEEDLPLALKLRQELGDNSGLCIQLGSIEQRMHEISAQAYLECQRSYLGEKEVLDLNYSSIDYHSTDVQPVALESASAYPSGHKAS